MITSNALFLLLVSLPLAGSAVTLKIATVSPDGSSWMQSMRQGAQEIATASDNRVRMKFYPGGVMGNDQAVLRKIRLGQLQGAAVSAGTLAKFHPDSQVYALPLRFHTLEEVDHVRGVLDTGISAGIEAGGFYLRTRGRRFRLPDVQTADYQRRAVTPAQGVGAQQ